MSVVTVNEGTPPPLKVRSYVWNNTTKQWVETVTDVPRTEAQWPALISLPNGQVVDADTTDIYLTDEQAQQLSASSQGADPKPVTVTTP
jgi:hypothetical protein